MGGSHYEVLGVAVDASDEAIHAAYQRQLQRLRERMQQGDPAPAAEFDAIRTAYAVLGDAAQRKAYDASLNEAATGGVAAATPAAETARIHEERFSFHGNGAEYFRIWIVNILLSVLTLGIYSAWAKVRREQYFHRNLLLDGSGFDYHATPRAILIGRLIAMGLLVLVSIAQRSGPMPYLIVMLVAMGLAPWLIMRALRFRARNTSYRGLRFAFRGGYGGALGAFVGYWLLTMITMGLLAPLWLREMRRYVLNHLYYANEPFSLKIGIKPFYRVVFMPVLVIFLSFLTFGIATAALGVAGVVILATACSLGVIFIYLAALAYIRMSLTNLVWNHVRLGEHHFISNMRFGSYLRLVVANWFMIVITLGIFWPWARVRLARYRAEHSIAVVAGGLDGFIAAAGKDEVALGDQAAEMFDFDVAL